MLARHGDEWLRGWMAYARLEPFGARPVAGLFGILAATVANSAGKEYKETLYPRDFVPSLEDPEDEYDAPVDRDNQEDLISFLREKFTVIDKRPEAEQK